MQFCAVQCTLRTVFLIFLFFKPESSNLVCRIEIRCLIHSYRLFFDKQSVHRYRAHGHSIVHTVFLPFCFLSQRAQIWCAGLNLDFVNILIHYFLTNRVPTVQIARCFPNFFCFSSQRAQIQCAGLKLEIVIILIQKQGVHSGHAHSTVYIEYCFSNIFVCLHTKLRPTLKNKKVGKTVRNLLCAFALCTSYLSKNSVNE